MEKSHLKLLVLVVFTVLIGLVDLSAMGKKESADGETIKIELWSLLKGERAELLDQQTSAFNQSQSGIFVDVIHQGGYTELKEKLTAATLARNLPALIMLDYIDVPFFAQNNIIEPLDEFLNNKDIQDFLPGLLIDLTVDDKLYAVPYNRSTQGLYVNKDLMNTAGIDKVPDTWDEYKEQALKVKKLGSDYYYGYSNFHQWFFDALSYSWGSGISTSDGKILFNTGEAVEMMKFFQNMMNEDLLLKPPTTTGGFEEQKGAFVQGKVATIFESTSWIKTMSDVVDFDWEFAFIPAGKGGYSITIGGGNFAITTQTSKNEKIAAAKFLQYITSKEQSAKFHMQTGYLPTRSSVMKMPAVKEFYKEHPDYLVSVEQTQYAKATPSYAKNIKNVWWRMTQVLQRVQIKGEDPQAVLNEIASEFQKEIDLEKSDGTFIK